MSVVASICAHRNVGVDICANIYIYPYICYVQVCVCVSQACEKECWKQQLRMRLAGLRNTYVLNTLTKAHSKVVLGKAQMWALARLVLSRQCQGPRKSFGAGLGNCSLLDQRQYVFGLACLEVPQVPQLLIKFHLAKAPQVPG